MTFEVPNLLASGDGDIVKVIAGIIALIIWGISAMASSQKKSQKQKQQEWQRTLENMQTQPGRVGQNPLPHPSSEAGPPRPQPMARPQSRPQPIPRPKPLQKPRPQPMAKRLPPPQRKPLPKKPAPQRQVQRPQPTRTFQAPPQTPPAATPHIAAAAPTPSRNRTAITTNAAAVSRWLTPATLRKQFILTEILQPPLALRDPQDRL